MKKRWLLSGVAAALLLSACGGDSTASSGSESEEASSEAITIKAYGELDPQVSAQQIIAEDQGFFEEQGLTVENNLMTGPDQNASLVSSGEADVIFGSIYNNISVAANDVDAPIFLPLANAGNTQAIIAREGLEVNEPADLEGLKIGATSGSGVLIALQSFAEDTGIDYDSFEFVNLQAADQMTALERGDVDLIAVWEPWVSNAERSGGTVLFTGKKSYLGGGETDVDYLNFFMTASVAGKFYEEHPEAVVGFAKALDQATDFINENIEEAAAIVAEKINIPEDECLAIMLKNDYSTEWSDAFINSAESMSEFMLETDSIDEIPDFSSYTIEDILSK